MIEKDYNTPPAPQPWPKTNRPNSPRPHNVQLVEETLKVARPWGLEAEVMWSALNAAAEANEHSQSFEEVLEYALGEWDLNKEGAGQ
tara:strand:+ start:270 stop:530 length:261 start_codon:yes stop_codon:yes gene_type:complete